MSPISSAHHIHLKALYNSGLLSGAGSAQFDRLAGVVQNVLDVPVAVISLIDADRQVFVGHRGLGEPWASSGETPLTHSFCKHVVEQQAALMVPDAMVYPLVANNAAIADLDVRAYLGVPLTLASGEVVGALAAIDTAPRVWTGRDLRQLSALADIVNSEMAVRTSELKWRSLFEDMAEGFFVAEALRDGEGKLTDVQYEEANPAFARLTGFSLDVVVGHTLKTLIADVPPEILPFYERVLATGQSETLEAFFPTLNAWYELRARALGSERIAVIFSDITAARQVQKRFDDAEERRRIAVEVGNIGVWHLDLQAETIEIDLRMLQMNGLSPDATPSVPDLMSAIHPEDRARVEHELHKLSTGVMPKAELTYRVIGIEDKVVRHVFVSGIASRDEAGQITHLIGAARDVTALISHEAQRDLMNRELAHRLKNSFALVQAIASQTMRSAADIDSIRESFYRRLQALSTAHDVLVDGEDSGAVARLVTKAFHIHNSDGGRLKMRGPRQMLGPVAALNLSLVIHELATNATKYGALAVPDGHVDVTWQVVHSADTSPELVLTWVEVGGPAATKPSRIGFGTRLIRIGFGGPEGSGDIQYTPKGVRCCLRAPLQQVTQDL